MAADAAADFNSIQMSQSARSGLGGGGGGGSLAPENIGVKSDNGIEHINALANTGSLAFMNVLKGLDQASPLKDMTFGLSKPLPSPVGGLAGGKAAGIFGARG